MSRQRGNRKFCKLLALVLLAAVLLAGCGNRRLVYYPAGNPEPMAGADGSPLTARVVRDDAVLRDAPRPAAGQLAKLAFGDRLLVYAFDPARGQVTEDRFALVGPPDRPGTVQGWAPAEYVLPSDARPTGWVVIRADSHPEAPGSNDTSLRTGPDTGFTRVGDVENWFLALTYARQGSYLLVGPARTPPGRQLGEPAVGGWLPAGSTLAWNGQLGIVFRNNNSKGRVPTLVYHSRAALAAAREGRANAGDLLYAAPDGAAPATANTPRFPLLAWEPGPPQTLQIALPGGAAGWTAATDPQHRRQVRVERLLSRDQVTKARVQFQRVADRARGDPRALAAAVEAVAGSPTLSLSAYCADVLGFPLQTPVLSTPAERLAAACVADAPACADALAALQRGADYLRSVEEEYAVTVHDGVAAPVREHSWSRGPRSLSYWWRAGHGEEFAWVPLEFLP